MFSNHYPPSIVLVVAFAVQFSFAWVFEGAIVVVLTSLVICIRISQFPSFKHCLNYLRLPLTIIVIGTIAIFSYYIKTLHLNPDVNWTLHYEQNYRFPPKGEVDPAYIFLFLPLVEFLLAAIFIGLFMAEIFLKKN